MEIHRAQEMQNAIARSDMFQILSILLHIPNLEVVEGLANGSIVEDLLNIISELGFSAGDIEKLSTDLLWAQNNKLTEKELLSEMRREYTRIFIHPTEPQIPIYETLFRYDPQTMKETPSLYISPAALDAEHCYKKAGLVMSKKTNEPSDHMAIEMEFMTYLYLQKALALKNNLEEEISAREVQIAEFEERHLKKWAKDFFTKLALENNNFYKAIGGIGSLFMTKLLEK
jgi:TorA maturation chaperone TorD